MDGKLKVFIAYSRKDTEFADRLTAALSAVGIDPYYDRQDILPGESWQDRLESLIGSSDTVLFIMSPDAIASPVALWEIEKAAALGKRLIPILWRRVSDIPALPPRLRALSWLSFEDPTEFQQSFDRLVRALNTDIAWLREHRRLTELAVHWDARARTDAQLLRGEDIRRANEWISRRPATAPEVSALQLQYIQASIAAAAENAAKTDELQAMIAAQAEREKELSGRLERLEQLENELREQKAKLERIKIIQQRNRIGIFISYRREDSAPWAGRIYERLLRDFPRKHLFMDVDTIQRGRNFNDVLDEYLDRSGVMLALIGKGWIGARSEQGVRRLDDQNDFVRREISTALIRGIAVIPLLIEGARLPGPQDNLPTELQLLMKQQASTIAHESFQRDIQGIVGDIRGHLRKSRWWPLAILAAVALVGLAAVGFQLGLGSWR